MAGDARRAAKTRAGSVTAGATFHKATCMISVEFFPHLPATGALVTLTRRDVENIAHLARLRDHRGGAAGLRRRACPRSSASSSSSRPPRPAGVEPMAHPLEGQVQRAADGPASRKPTSASTTSTTPRPSRRASTSCRRSSSEACTHATVAELGRGLRAARVLERRADAALPRPHRPRERRAQRVRHGDRGARARGRAARRRSASPAARAGRSPACRSRTRTSSAPTAS